MKVRYQQFIKFPSLSKLVFLMGCLLLFPAFQIIPVTPTTTIVESTVSQLKEIKFPNEVEVEWLLIVHKIGNTTPQELKPVFEEVKKRFPDYFQLTSPLLLLTKSEIDYLAGDYENAGNKTLQAIKLLEAALIQDVASKKMRCLSYLSFSKISKYIKAENKGLTYGIKGLELAQKIDFPTGEFLAYNQIGKLNGYTSKNYTLSLDYYLKAQSIIPRTRAFLRPYLKGFILNNIAINWAKDGQIEKSIAYRLQLLEELETFENITLAVATNNNLGTTYYKLKKYDLAEKYLLETLALMNYHQLEIDRGIPLNKLGLLKIETGKIQAAKNYAEKIEKWLNQYKFTGKKEVSFYLLKSMSKN